MIEQSEVYAMVAQRGYCAGWTHAQFLCRQVTKLQEEMAELAEETLPNNSHWRDVLRATIYAGNKAAERFDSVVAGPFWQEAGAHVCEAGTMERIKDELADLQVVLFCAAQAASLLTGKGFDVVEAALEKAECDVERGIR